MSFSNEAGTGGVNAEGGNSSAQSYSSLDKGLKEKMPSGEGTFATSNENRQSYSSLDGEGQGNNADASLGPQRTVDSAADPNNRAEQTYSAAEANDESGKGIGEKIKDAFKPKTAK